jgi:serine kinase of HPr protein (carbohydrate metabolism regulator)
MAKAFSSEVGTGSREENAFKKNMTPTVHASAVLLGHRGILIRGPSGAGKSRLALALLQHATPDFTRLVGDDRIHLEAVHGRLLMRPAKALEGLIEIRGAGIVRLPYEPVAVAALVIDLGVPDVARLPQETEFVTEIDGVALARLPVAHGDDPLARLKAYVFAESRFAGRNLNLA